MTHADPYRVLGLTPTATAGEVRRAYRRAMLDLHPDVAADPQATARAAAVNEAYAVLGDPERRAWFDAQRRAAQRRRRATSLRLPALRLRRAR